MQRRSEAARFACAQPIHQFCAAEQSKGSIAGAQTLAVMLPHPDANLTDNSVLRKQDFLDHSRKCRRTAPKVPISAAKKCARIPEAQHMHAILHTSLQESASCPLQLPRGTGPLLLKVTTQQVYPMKGSHINRHVAGPPAAAAATVVCPIT